jgi:hypothetical protein
MSNLERLEAFRRELSDICADISTELAQDGAVIEESCVNLVHIYNLKRDINYIYEEMVTVIADKMPQSMIFLSDGTEIERKQSADRKAWDHKGLANEVAAKISQMSVDMDTGEITLTPEEMMIKMLDYAAPSYWRVGELGKIGVNPSKYCETSEGRTSIVIKKGKV